jgi:hypothetical protein
VTWASCATWNDPKLYEMRAVGYDGLHSKWRKILCAGMKETARPARPARPESNNDGGFWIVQGSTAAVQSVQIDEPFHALFASLDGPVVQLSHRVRLPSLRPRAICHGQSFSRGDRRLGAYPSRGPARSPVRFEVAVAGSVRKTTGFRTRKSDVQNSF